MKIQQLAIGTGIATTLLLSAAVRLPVHGEPGGEHHHDDMSHDEISHNGTSHDGMSHDGNHVHPQVEVSADLPVPAVVLAAYQDAVNGWNLQLQLENFELAPATVNEAGPQNEGHAHLYINGEKVTRLYSDWYYLGELDPGENEIVVTLNTNIHEDLTVNGEVISASTVVSVEE
ncbi:MAG: hypothetical protein AAF268_09505 [Cyanobacteria bacterium P01_A01_bin.3]